MRVLITVLAAGMVAFTGCSSTSSTQSTASTRVTDADLAQTVKNQIAADQQLTGVKIDVSADAAKNQVTLSGTVPTETTRTEAVNVAKASSTGVTVVDKIEVKPAEISRSEYTDDMARDARAKAKAAGEKIGNSLDDAWIYSKITAKLVSNSETPARKINVDVTDQRVVLRGVVESAAAKEEAGRVASETDGVKHVSNLLKIRAAG
jgi:osmotically-inducible protein OsmY